MELRKCPEQTDNYYTTFGADIGQFVSLINAGASLGINSESCLSRIYIAIWVLGQDFALYSGLVFSAWSLMGNSVVHGLDLSHKFVFTARSLPTRCLHCINSQITNTVRPQ